MREVRRGEIDKKKIPNCPRYIFLCEKLAKSSLEIFSRLCATFHRLVQLG